MSRKWKALFAAVLMAVSVLLCSTTALANPSKETYNDPTQITVALFPYVPDFNMFQKMVQKCWKEIEPDVKLNLVKWDGYEESDVTNIDVFMYDALSLTYLAESGCLRPLEISDIDNPEGIFDFLLEGCTHNGTLYGIPALFCSNFLMYDKNDTALDEVDNIFELYEVVGERKTKKLLPDDRSEGLIICYPDNYPFYYLEALADFGVTSTVTDDKLALTTLEPQELFALKIIKNLFGEEKAMNYYTDRSFRSLHPAQRFNAGRGRVYLGYSEDMVHMGDILDQLALKFISFSMSENVPLFYADAVSINNCVENEEKIAKCLKLINMLASEDFLYELMLGNGKVQYMLPVRKNLFSRLGQDYPIYNRLEELVNNENNRVARPGAGIYDYLEFSYDILEP